MARGAGWQAPHPPSGSPAQSPGSSRGCCAPSSGLPLPRAPLQAWYGPQALRCQKLGRLVRHPSEPGSHHLPTPAGVKATQMQHSWWWLGLKCPHRWIAPSARSGMQACGGRISMASRPEDRALSGTSGTLQTKRSSLPPMEQQPGRRPCMPPACACTCRQASTPSSTSSSNPAAEP